MTIAEIPYLSPVARWNPLAQTLVVQSRDTRTGAVLSQTPNPIVVRQMEQAWLETPTATNNALKTAGAASKSSAAGSPPRLSLIV